MIGEEADAQLKRDHFSGLGEVAFLRLVQEILGLTKVAFGQGVEKIHSHSHLIEVALVLVRRTGQRPHHVAKVVVDEPRHYGVEIDDAHHFIGFLIEQHVVDLGVVVRDALRQFALGLCVGKNLDDAPVGSAKINLRFCCLNPVLFVFRNRLFQCVDS